MPRTDHLAHLQHLAQQSTFFTPTPAPTFASAHGCLDLLGALEAEGGGTLAQMTLPGQIAVLLQPRTDSLLRVRSTQITPPLGDPEIQFDLAPLAALSAADLARHCASVPASAAWAVGLLALTVLLHQSAAPKNPQPLLGANLLITGDLPMGAGQASSTALLAAAARALHNPGLARGSAYSKKTLDPPLDALAPIIATAEALAAGSIAPPARGNIIDALTTLQPRLPHTLLRYSAQPHRLVGPVPLPPDIHVFALDTGVRYSGTRTTLEELRIAAAMGLRIIETIYRDLGQHHTPLHGYLTNTSPLLYRQYFRTLLPKRLRGNDFVRTYGPLVLEGTSEGHDLLPLLSEDIDSGRIYRVRTAVDHLIAENEHAEQFVQAMEELADASAASNAGVPPASPRSSHSSGAPISPAPLPPKTPLMDEPERQRTLARAGRLLLASHHSYRLRLELSCKEADWLVDRLMESGPDKGIYGARITGAGGGGTVAALLHRSREATDTLLDIIKSYHQVTGLTLGVTEA